MICIVMRPLVLFLLTLVTTIRQKLLEDIEKCNYFTLLMDGSTDSSFTEQEPISVLFLGSKGTPSVKFLSIEKVEIAHVAHEIAQSFNFTSIGKA